jgi:hypothetical protein
MAEHSGVNRNEPSTAAPAREIPNGGGYTPDGITPRVRLGGPPSIKNTGGRRTL